MTPILAPRSPPPAWWEKPAAFLGLPASWPDRQCRIGGAVLHEDDLISLDGNIGAVHAGRLIVLVERPDRALAAIANWRRAAAA